MTLAHRVTKSRYATLQHLFDTILELLMESMYIDIDHCGVDRNILGSSSNTTKLNSPDRLEVAN